MAMNSINTNTGALIALQNLNSTSSQLSQVQNRINTGLRVSSAKDDGSTWAIAQNQRASIGALDSVKDSLNRAISTVDVAVSAGETASDLLSQMKAKALAATDTSLDSTSRTALFNDFKALRDQLGKVVANADFNGSNMVKTSGTTIYALANASGSSSLTVAAQNLGLGGSIVTVTSTSTFSTVTTANSVLALVNASITNVSAAVAKLGTGSNALNTHLKFIQKLQDTMTAGVGNLVDADVAKESANLQALQTKQQLAVQALGIANQSSGILLSLFR
ncbi:MAG: flagellin [Caulobacteraceae bacterium]